MKPKSGRGADTGKKDREIVISDLFFGKVLNNADAVIIVTGHSGRIEFANKKCRKRLSKSGKELRGKDWISCIAPSGKEASAKKKFVSLRKKGRTALFDTYAKGAAGPDKTMRWIFIPLDPGGGLRKHFLLIGNGQTGFLGGMERPDRKCLEKARKDVVKLLFSSAMRCDPETAAHSLRVARFAELLAKKVKLGARKTEDLKTAALLHDMGKLVVDPAVLFKKGKLDKKEFEHIKKHLNWGADLIGLICFLKGIAGIMYGHHEDHNGRGYPEGLRGEEISIDSKILCIADIYEALTADRPYREAFTREEAVAIMEYEKGHKLDPRLTDIFVEMALKGEIDDASDKSGMP